MDLLLIGFNCFTWFVFLMYSCYIIMNTYIKEAIDEGAYYVWAIAAMYVLFINFPNLFGM